MIRNGCFNIVEYSEKTALKGFSIELEINIIQWLYIVKTCIWSHDLDQNLRTIMVILLVLTLEHDSYSFK